jgi:hypothetical protein
VLGGEGDRHPAAHYCLARAFAEERLRLRRVRLRRVRLRRVRLRLDQASKSLLNMGSNEAPVAANLDIREQAAARVTFDRRYTHGE